jgi:Zn-dependent protease with chaperone function
MAYELQIPQNGERVKIRNPWAVALLPLVTFGIYHLVWWYRVNRELRDFGEANGEDLGQSPTNSLLALFPGAIIVVPALVSYWRGSKRVMAACALTGQEQPNGWIAIILYLILAPAFWAYLQVSLNNVWESEGQPLPGEPPVGA